MAYSRLEQSPELSDWSLLAKDSMTWMFLAYQFVIRETYTFPYVISFPCMVFIATNIVSTMHTACHYYKEESLAYKHLKSICSVLSTFTLSISILESIIFFFTMWMFPHMMPYYTAIESSHVMGAVFIRAIPLLSNVATFSSNDTSFGIPNAVLAWLFFALYYERLCAYLPDNNGMFIHHLLDMMTENERTCLFAAFLPAVSLIIMAAASSIKYAVTDDGCIVVRQAHKSSDSHWIGYLLGALGITAFVYCTNVCFEMHII